MNIEFLATSKDISETLPGELIVLQLGGSRALAITLKQNLDEDQTWIAILDCNESSYRMTYLITDFDTSSCLSYGSYWCFELIENEST